MNKLILGVLAGVFCQACQMQTNENASPTYREAFFANELSISGYLEGGLPEGLLELDSGWTYLGKDSVGGIERMLPDFQGGELLNLPHRLPDPSQSLWYRKDVYLEKGFLFIDADDGAQLWANEVRIPRDQEGDFFHLASEGDFRLTIRAVNNAMAGGLRKVRWILEENFRKSLAEKKEAQDSVLLERKIGLVKSLDLAHQLEGKTREEKSALLEKFPILMTDPVLLVSPSGDPFVRWVSELGGKANLIFEEGHEVELESADGVFTLDFGLDSTLSFRLLQDQSDFGWFQFRLPNPKNSLKLAMWGDAQGGWETFGKLSAAMAKHKPHMSIGAGDLVNNGSEEFAYPRFLQKLSTMQTSQLLVPGNHDYDGFYDDLNPRLMKQYLFRSQDSTFGMQVIGPLAILTLDPNSHFPVDLPEGSEQRIWFEQAMESQAWRAAAWRMIVLHQPPYSQGWPGYHGEKTIRQLLEPYFHRGLVDLVVAGHTHDYERVSLDFSGHSVHFLVVGGAGGGLEPEGKASEYPMMDKMIKQYHFGILEIKNKGVNWEVFGLDGEVLDRFSMKK